MNMAAIKTNGGSSTEADDGRFRGLTGGL